MVYYQSEFDIPIAQQASLDEAIESLELPAGSSRGRQGRLQIRPSDALSINSVISQGLAAQN